MRRVIPLLTILLGCSATAALAQTAAFTPIGVNTVVGSKVGAEALRFAAADYDTRHGVYLVAWGRFPSQINYRVVDANGVPVGGVGAASQSGNAMLPRVSYAHELDVFLVTYLVEVTDNVPSVFGRFFRYVPGAGLQPLSGEFRIQDERCHPESPPNIAYSPSLQAFLVVWATANAADRYVPSVKGLRLTWNGTAPQALGGPIDIATGPYHEMFPDVAYGGSLDEFMVVYMFETDQMYSTVARVQAGTGLVVGRNTLSPGALRNNYPEIAFSPTHGKYLVIASQITRTVGWAVNPNGEPATAQAVIAQAAPGETIAGGQGLGLAYSQSAGLYAAVLQSSFLGGQDAIGAVNVSANAVPSSQYRVTTNPILYTEPQVATGGSSRALVVTAEFYTNAKSQLLQFGGGLTTDPLPPPPPPPTPEPAPPSTIDLSPTAAPNGSWFFAEGSVGQGVGFDTYYLIENAFSVPVSVRMHLSTDAGVTSTYTFTVDAYTRATKRLKDFGGWSGNATAVFQSTTPGVDIRVERAMYWKEFGGGHLATGMKEVKTRWYFAEGSRNGELFRNYYMTFNPSNTEYAPVTIDFYRRDGVKAKSVTEVIPPRGRVTVNANVFPELANTDFSAVLTSPFPVVAERAMYWNDFTSGHSSEGVTSLSPTWYFAEGAVFLRFWTYYLILNPNPAPVSVAVDYIGEGRLIDSDVYVVNPTTRRTLLLNDELRRLGHSYEGGVAAKFRTLGGEPIIVERSTYWGRPWQEGANSVGLRQPAATWFMPEGTTADGFDSYQFVMNPNAHAITVRLTVITQNSIRFLDDIALSSLGRKTFYMNEELAKQGVAPQPFSVIVQCIGGDCVAEHAVYWHRLYDGNLWGGGSTAVGIPGPPQ